MAKKLNTLEICDMGNSNKVEYDKYIKAINKSEYIYNKYIEEKNEREFKY